MSGNYMKASQTDFITAQSATKKTEEKLYRFLCKDSILFRKTVIDVHASSLDEAKSKLLSENSSLFILSHEEL